MGQHPFIRAQETLGVLVGADAPLDAAEEVRLPEAAMEDEAMREAEDRRADLRAARTRIEAADRVVRVTVEVMVGDTNRVEYEIGDVAVIRRGEDDT